MEYRFGTVALEEINLTDHSFRITTTRDKTSLVESIRSDGILVPPALRRHGADWIIVSGFRRIQACMQADATVVGARLLADHLSPLDGLRLSVIENSSQRTLNPIETARAVRRLRHLCPSDHSFLSEMTRLGLPTTRKVIERFERLDQLGAELKAAIVDGTIGPEMALAIGALPSDDQAVVNALFTRIPMSLGKQRDILNLAQDIAGRDNEPLAAVLQKNRIRVIADDPERDRNRKSADIRRYLRQVRYPNLSRVETRYQKALGVLKLGPHMRIDHPEGFEGPFYTLSLRFKSLDDLHRAHQILGHVIQNPAINDIFLK